jgi:hypothetical protein
MRRTWGRVVVGACTVAFVALGVGARADIEDPADVPAVGSVTVAPDGTITVQLAGSLTKFDPSLGTLTGAVTMTTLIFSGSIAAANPGPEPLTFNEVYAVATTTNIAGVTYSGPARSLTLAGTVDPHATATLTGGVVFFGEFATARLPASPDLVGPGLLPYGITVTLTPNGGPFPEPVSFDFPNIGVPGSTVQEIGYEFTPAAPVITPEPGGLALAGLAAAGLALVMFRSRVHKDRAATRAGTFPRTGR